MKVSIIINNLFIFEKSNISACWYCASRCKNCRFDKTKTHDPKAKNVTKTRESKTKTLKPSLETSRDQERVSITTSLHHIRL